MVAAATMYRYSREQRQKKIASREAEMLDDKVVDSIARAHRVAKKTRQRTRAYAGDTSHVDDGPFGSITCHFVWERQRTVDGKAVLAGVLGVGRRDDGRPAIDPNSEVGTIRRQDMQAEEETE
jgi:hypothetical protein